MDKISRRSFLKGAGMTALAVAAVGMMTGCKGEDVVPDPQKVDVAVIFCQSCMGVVDELPTGKIQVVEKAAEADQEAAAAEGTAAADTETTTNNNQTKHTILTFSKAIAADAVTIGIPAEVTFYDRLGITEEEVEQMKGELA